jgi:GGDEF domain-containing protein
VRCSIGIGVGLAGDDPDAVLALADRDLYATKASKRAVPG